MVHLIIGLCMAVAGEVSCPESESVLMFPSKTKCEAFIRREDFDPSDYLKAGSYDLYSVGCEDD